MSRRFAIVAILLMLSCSYLYLHRDIVVPTNRPLSSFPVQIGKWVMSGETFMSDSIIDNLKPTDYLMRTYKNERGEMVSLYVGYHGGGKESGEIHSPKHCLPGSGWLESSSQKMVITVDGGLIRHVQAVYQKGMSRDMFFYWFQVMGKTLDNEYALKLHEIINSALYRRRDAAFIRISVPFETDEESAWRRGEAFIKEIHPVLSDFLPK